VTSVAARPGAASAVERLTVSGFRVPTDKPEADGTASWSATTVIVVELAAGGCTGIGYTYGDPAVGTLIDGTLRELVEGADAMDVSAVWWSMAEQLRNRGRPGIGAMAMAAVDAALWDLKARLLGLPLVTLLGGVREDVAAYGSGGFTSYSERELCDQLAGWAEDGYRMVKMKVGSDPRADPGRVAAARRAIGPDVELFVDANGAHDPASALRQAHAFAAEDVTWFEEPVSSDDLAGLRDVRAKAPPGIAIAAGEYGSDPAYFHHMLAAGAVDVLQADATRCGGITGFLNTAAQCEAACRPLSAHTAPALHTHPCCALRPVVHVEAFHDHLRIERLLFDDPPAPAGGRLTPDRGRPGLGLELRRADAARYAL
jgi:L-alanine-DL-glutamate epimerase-like enolase superfamily enzyme